MQGNRRRNQLLNLDALAEVAEADDPEALARGHREWIEGALRLESRQRDDVWTKRLAVGSDQFVMKFRKLREDKRRVCARRCLSVV